MGGIRFTQEQIDAIRLKNQRARSDGADVILGAREAKKKRAKPRHLEDDLQMLEVKLFEIQYPQYAEDLIAIPNGGKREKKIGRDGKFFCPSAKRMKAMGVKAGVYDLFIPVPRAGYHGLWIENKVGKNGLSDAQEIFGERMRFRGYAVKEVWTLDEFQETCRWYFGRSE